MNSNDELQYLKDLFDKTQNLIVRCDQKISITFALFSGIWTIILNAVCSNNELCFMLKNNKISVCFVRCGIVLSFLALVFFASALFSVLKGNKNNLEFFGCSQKHSLQCFTSRIKQCGNDERKDYMIEQIYVNNKIVYRKHCLFNHALILSLFSLVFIFLSIVF